VRPAEASQVVEHRPRRITLLAVLADAHCAVPLAQLLAVGGEHHRQVSELGHPRAERLVDEDLRRGVDHVVSTARDERHLHRDVVHHRPEVVERHSVAAQEHEVLLRGVGRGHRAEDLVDVRHDAGLGHLEAYDERQVRLVGACPAGARVPELRLGVARLERSPLRVELLLGTEAAIGLARRDQPVGVLAIQREALHLRVRPVLAAHAGSFVPGEAQPLHRIEDDALALQRAALLVRVLDAQDEDAVGLSRPQPVEERGAHTADVEVPRRRRGEANAGDRRGHCRDQ
jgi:hypothetical protein